MVLAVMLALMFAIMRESDNYVLKSVSLFFVWFFRGTPIYMQLVFWGLVAVLFPTISFGIPFGPTFFHWETSQIMTALVCAIIGLSLNESAYLAEIIRAGFNSVDYGQNEAAKALGMGKTLTLRKIVLPQAMRIIVPPLGNETISMLKTTSLVLAIPFAYDITFVTGRIGSKLFLPIPLLIVSAIWYLFITSILMVAQSRIEKYFGKGDRKNVDVTFLDVTP
jgi:polar amino acid transport system permease protein